MTLEVLLVSTTKVYRRAIETTRGNSISKLGHRPLSVEVSSSGSGLCGLSDDLSNKRGGESPHSHLFMEEWLQAATFPRYELSFHILQFIQ